LGQLRLVPLATISTKRCIDTARVYQPGFAVYITLAVTSHTRSINLNLTDTYQRESWHMATKTTKPTIAKKAATVLSSSSTGKTSKSAAGSALTQVNPKKVTSPKAASVASKVLRDGRTSSASKCAAGSALSQVPAKKSPTVIASDTKSGTSSGGPRKPKK
jgi:hypothetical protein